MGYMKKSKAELELNQVHTTLLVFLNSYNESIPSGFTPASVGILKKFQDVHPVLFKRNGLWSIARHRKKFMDWLSSHPEVS